LKSVKETYTRTLSPEELDDNETDYISGFQIIDTNLRITILEGITGKAMNLIKEKLPKLELNSEKKKIFSNSKILFNKRIYSDFNLCLKFIKLRNPLVNILQTADIYLKANKYREIFNAFLNLGFILKSPTFESITNAKLFPSFESLSQLERKYADIINDEDMTGIYIEKKKKNIQSINEKKINTTNSYITTDNNSSGIQNAVVHSFSKGTRTGYSGKKNMSENINEEITRTRKAKRIQDLDSYNKEFIKKKKEEIGRSMSFNKKENFLKTHKTNCDYIKRLNQNTSTFTHFWAYEKISPMENVISSRLTTEEGSGIDFDAMKNDPYASYYSSNSNTKEMNQMLMTKKIENEIPQKEKLLHLYSQQKDNIYSNHIEELRKTYYNDKDNYYTYSMDYLTLSFPIVENKNRNYENYIENKKVKLLFLNFNKFYSVGFQIKILIIINS
jgi:hypothetical protein